MAIAFNKQGNTVEEKFQRIHLILSRISHSDAEFLKEFIYDLCKRYTDKSNELDNLSISKAIGTFNNYEVQYIKQIISELGLE